MDKNISTVIIGASGYTGADLIRILSVHDYVDIKALTANEHIGKSLGAVHPQFSMLNLPNMQSVETVEWENIDVAFCALPHGTAQNIIRMIPKHVKIIDMSADFRLKNKDVYETWYQCSHESEDLLNEAVYGLTEHYREDIKKARLVACPGCYPTATLLLLLPLIKAGLISEKGLIIDAKSGVSGAGRAVKKTNLFCENAESIQPYSVSGHRHAPEIEQELSKIVEQDVMVSFTPHLVPVNRGELVTVYAETKGYTAKHMRECLKDFYQNEAFVHVTNEGEVPTTKQVRGSNFCLLSVFDDRIENRVILIATIDNLVKGSSGQAVQNMNIMFDIDETEALKQNPLYP